MALRVGLGRFDWRSWLIATSGILILSANIVFLSWQFQLVSGGVPGYGLAISFLTKWELSLILLVVNTLILAVEFVLAGKRLGIKGVYGYLLLSFLIKVWQEVFSVTQVESTFLVMVLVAIVAGIIAGGSIALIMSKDYSFGSYTSLVLALQSIPKWSRIKKATFFIIFDSLLVLIVIWTLGIEKGSLVAINAAVFIVTFRFLYHQLVETSKSSRE